MKGNDTAQSLLTRKVNMLRWPAPLIGRLPERAWRASGPANRLAAQVPRLTWVGAILLFAGVLTLGLSSCDITQGPDYRDPWIGPWTMIDRCTADTTEYELLFTRGSNLGDNIFIDGIGLYQVGARLEAIVTGSRLVIPVQSFQISSIPNLRYEFSGSGSMSGGIEITISYTILTLQDDIIIDIDECLATGR